MAVYEIQSPDGSVFEITAPDNATEAEVLAYAQSQQSAPSQGLSGYANSLWEGIKSGTTLNFGDEIQAGIAGLVAGIGSPDLTIPQAYDMALSDFRGEQASAQQQNPITYLLGNVGGSLVNAGGVVNAGSRIAPGASSALAGLASTRPIATGAALGAGQGGLVGFGGGEGGFSERIQEAVPSAIAGGAIGGLAGGVSSALASRTGSAAPRVTSQDVRQQAGAVYQRADQLGGVLKPSFTDDFIDDIQTLSPQTTAGRIVAGDDEFTQIVGRFEGLRGKPLTLQEANEVDKVLGDQIDKFIDGTTGKPDAIGRKLIQLQSTLRNKISGATQNDIVGTKEGFEALKEGRKLWSRAAKLNDIERIVGKAELMQVPATAIKTGFRTLASNPARLRGYTDAEKALIRKAAETGIATDVLNVFGSRLIPIGAGVAGTSVGGPVGGAIAGLGSYAASAAARRTAEAMQMAKANAVTDLIANGIPTQKITDPLLTAYAALAAGGVRENIRQDERYSTKGN